MLDTFLRLGTNPVIPVSLGIGIYLWATFGFYHVGRPWMGGMWACYAAANFCLVMDHVTKTGSGIG